MDRPSEPVSWTSGAGAVAPSGPGCRRRGGGKVKRRKLVVGLVALALSVGSAAPAFGDPAFGPGNKGGGEGNSGPQEGKCHPPGQTTETPGCK